MHTQIKSDINFQISLEAATHQDILQGDFIDHPMNATFKHLLGFHWVKENCLKDESSAPLLVIKLEDDVFVEIFHLFQFVQFVYGGQPDPKSLICDVVQSLNLTPATFDYCNGAAFMITPDLIQPLLEAAAASNTIISSSHGQEVRSRVFFKYFGQEGIIAEYIFPLFKRNFVRKKNTFHLYFTK